DPLRRAAGARLRALAAPARALLPLRGDDALALVRRRLPLPGLPGCAALGGAQQGLPLLPAAAAAEVRATAPRVRHCERRRALVVRQPHPGEPVRRDPLAARRLCLPRLPLHRDARLEAPRLGALDDRRARRALPARAVVRRRLHGEPLRRRPADRLRARDGGAAPRAAALAAARPPRVTRSRLVEGS